MLVQLARDLGEDFYVKYWVRVVALLSQTVNHPDFSVIEVFPLEVKTDIGGIQYSLMGPKIPCSPSSRQLVHNVSSTCAAAWKIPTETICAPIRIRSIFFPPQTREGAV
jgi:hypothetical protein